MHYVCFSHQDNKEKEMSIERRLEIINIILDKRPSLLNAKNSKGQTALHFLASAATDERLFEFFVERGIDCNVQDLHLRTPLHYACMSKQKAFIKYVIKYSTSINIYVQDEDEKTALDYAYPCKFDFVEMILELRDKYKQK